MDDEDLMALLTLFSILIQIIQMILNHKDRRKKKTVSKKRQHSKSKKR